MNIKFSSSARKFIEKSGKREQEKIRLKIKMLLQTIEESGFIPFQELHIRKLKGEWQGFYRMRIGAIRVIFRIDREQRVIYVYDIDYRGSVY
ncbi:MAG: type II toxin-antitoxin system RelE/ParE family toxin [Calditrichaeota bacterium]|nr:type II toxin-antitoxin system RelE/ParE family toxin [Calditrichota bacterium]